MPYLTDAELGKSLRANQLFPVYFLYGKETFLSAGYLERLLEKAVPKGTEGFNLQKFDGQNPDMVSLQVALEGLPMMAGRKCVLFSNPNLEKMRKEDFESLLALVQDPNPTSVFVIYVSAFDLNPKKMSRVKKLGDAAAKTGAVVDFSPPHPGGSGQIFKGPVPEGGAHPGIPRRLGFHPAVRLRTLHPRGGGGQAHRLQGGRLRRGGHPGGHRAGDPQEPGSLRF